MSKILKNTVVTSIVNYIGVIIGFISILFIQTKVLTEDEIGIVRLILDKALFVFPFFLLGINYVSSRFYFHFEKDKNNYNSFISLLLGTPLITFVFGFFIFYYFKEKIDISNFYLISVVLFFTMYIQIFESYLNTKQKIIFPSFLKNILFRLLYIVLLILYYYTFINFIQLTYLYVSIYFVHFIILLFYFKNHLTFKYKYNSNIVKHPIFKDIVIFSSFMILGAGSGVFIARLDTIMIEGITNNPGFVGVYTVAIAMASIIEIPKRPIIRLALPMISKKLNENKLNDVLNIYKKSSINLLIVGSILFTLIWLNIDLIFFLIPNGDVYAKGKYVVFFIALAKLFDLAVGVNNEIIQSSKFYKWNMFLMPFLAVISISLNYYFISNYSYLGAAIATAISIYIYNVLRSILVYVKLNLNPFSSNYLKVIPFIFLPFILNYFISTNNLFFNAIINTLLVLVVLIFPVYKLKLSKDFNKIIEELLKRLQF